MEIHQFEHRWIEDVERIQKILLARGKEASLHDCAAAWELYSESMCAGWMALGEQDESIFQTVMSFIHPDYNLIDIQIGDARARVSKDCDEETLEALKKMVEIAFKNSATIIFNNSNSNKS